MKNLYQMPQKGRSTKQERESFWRRIIAEQKASGMSALKFCRQNQISVSTFKNRKYRLQKLASPKAYDKSARNSDGGGDKPRFVPLQIIEEIGKDEQALENVKDAKVKIIFSNGHAVEFPFLAAENILPAIITQVSRLSC